MMFILGLFSVFFLFLEKLASIVPMFQSDYDYDWRLIPAWSVKIL